MAEYCDPVDVQNRLTAGGYQFYVDDDQNGLADSAEVAASVTSAIQWAGSRIDEVMEEAGCRLDYARGAANNWLRQIAIDFAVYRVSTNGGNDVIQCFKDDFDAAKASLDKVRGGMKVPGLTFPYPYAMSNTSHRFPFVINSRR